jgi:hypothetical protein
MLVEADRKDWIISCCTHNTKISEEKLANGIVSGHAYALLAVKEITNKNN